MNITSESSLNQGQKCVHRATNPMVAENFWIRNWVWIVGGEYQVEEYGGMASWEKIKSAEIIGHR